MHTIYSIFILKHRGFFLTLFLFLVIVYIDFKIILKLNLNKSQGYKFQPGLLLSQAMSI